ncbi:MAG TPA: response regulator [Burkholderiales bacterium]|nr:response regulator [Burkholderiales bacterium]
MSKMKAAGTALGHDSPQERSAEGRHYTILVVDDDDLLRRLLVEWLVMAGYEVREAIDGQAAVESLLAQPAGLVITDMHMPGASGAGVLAMLQRHHPGTPAIAVSAHFGSGRGYSAENAIALGARRVLAKPFSRTDLLEAVREVLDADRPAAAP